MFDFRNIVDEIFVRASNFLNRHGLSFFHVPVGDIFLKKHVCIILKSFARVNNDLICLALSRVSMLEL